MRSMKIILYNNTSSNNTCTKTLVTVTEVDGTLPDEFDVRHGYLHIRNSAVLKCNYIHIPSLERYYYVLSADIINGDTFRLELKCDVLMSFAEIIKQCTATRIIGGDNSYISGNTTEYDVRPHTQVTKFADNDFFKTDGTMVLITLKG